MSEKTKNWIAVIVVVLTFIGAILVAYGKYASDITTFKDAIPIVRSLRREVDVLNEGRIAMQEDVVEIKDDVGVIRGDIKTILGRLQ